MLTAVHLREILDYDPKTGIFKWKQSGPGKRPDRIAGTLESKGYIRIMIDGKLYRAHRLAWLYMTGEWPKEEIDHVHGNRADNRWSELREATPSFNRQNQRETRSDNHSGFLGVRCMKGLVRSKPWQAQIMVEGKNKHLGYYSTPEEANEIYLKAKRELHEGCTI